MIGQLLEPLVCERFRTDQRYREGHLRIINALPQRKVMGLHSPEMKALAKSLVKERGEDALRDFESYDPRTLTYEETLIWGFVLSYLKLPPRRKLELLAPYVPILDNWAVCDSFCASAKWMAKLPPQELLDRLRPWFGSKREFEVRFAIVASMTYLLDDCLDEVFELVDNLDFGSIVSEYASVSHKPATPQEGTVLGQRPYYVRMAVAWLLATALAKHPCETLGFVGKSKLPEDVLRLYVRKARESFRTKNVKAL